MGGKVSDRKPYLDKRNKLKASLGNVYNCQKDSYIVSLSRKGPRLLEKMFKDDAKDDTIERKELNTITEFALPFLYYNLAREKENEGANSSLHEIRLVDDAIYYGSTIEGLWNEMMLYEQIYGLQGRIKHPVYACIKSQRSKQLPEMDIYAEESISEGFEHYFIKNLTADLRTLHKCLEVEFPIVRYTFDSAIDQNALFEKICESYDSAYIIEHPDTNEGNSTEKDAVITSVNILLSGSNAIFEKMRITLENNEIRISCMAPRNIHMSYRTLSRLFFSTEIGDVWRWAVKIPFYMVNLLTKRNEAFGDYHDLLLNVIKSLVALANYFYSYNTIVEQKSKLEGIFTSLGYNSKFQGVSEQDVFYLIGDRKQAQEVMRVFMNLYKDNKTLSPYFQGIGDVNINYQVFESDFPKGLIEDIGIQNKKLIENCKNLLEKLSALFYNQTLILVNGTRGINKKDEKTRLRFGHTFGSLYKSVLADRTIDAKTIHEWVDKRIDQGCIVPQYVLDAKSNCWTRVFRPGENEDVLLGQLVRFATFCFSSIDQTAKIGWVPQALLSDMLTIVMMKSDYDLSREMGIPLFLMDRNLMFSVEGGGDALEVIDYLKRMNVFEGDGPELQISNNLKQFDFGVYTSMGEEVDSNIRTIISEVMTRCDNESLSIYEIQTYTNIFFVNSEPLASFMADYDKVADYMRRMVDGLKCFANRQEWLGLSNDGLDFLVYYNLIDKWLVKPSFWDDFIEREGFSRETFEKLERGLANYQLMADTIIMLICLDDLENFFDIADAYHNPSWGEDIINNAFLQDSISLYKDDSLDKAEKERRLLEEADKLLE